MSKTPREILKEFYVKQSQDIRDDNFPLTATNEALADLKEAVLAAIGKDMSMDEAKCLAKVRRDHTNGTRYAFDADAVVRAKHQNNLRADLRKAILTMFEGE